MSFSDLIDGFDTCEKRTTGCLKLVHELGVYLGKYGQSKKDLTKESAVLKQYTTKKLTANANIDNGSTVKTSLDCLVSEIDGLLTKEFGFAGRLIDIAVEIEAFVREREVRRKKLVDDSHRIQREYNNVMDALKKAKEKYRKLSQERDTVQGQLAKAKTTMNAQKISQMNLKVTQAQEKVAAAESEYKDTLKQANEKQNSYYRDEMPSVLAEFNQFETERIVFMKEKLKQVGTDLLEFPAMFERAGQSISQNADSINPAGDITVFIEANRTNATIPAAIEFEPYASSFSSNSNPSTNSTATTELSRSSSNTNLSSPPQAQTQPQTQIQAQPQTQPLVQPQPQAHAQFQANSPASPRAPNSHPPSSASLENIRPPPPRSGPPSSTINSSSPPITIGSAANTQSQAYTAPVKESEPATVQPSICRCRGLYDYKATSDTELSFNKGTIIEVLDRDPTGWWFSQLNGKQGFVPMNYVEVLN